MMGWSAGEGTPSHTAWAGNRRAQRNGTAAGKPADRTRVLVVTASGDLLDQAAGPLQQAGCDVVAVGDAEEALRRLQSEPFDVIILHLKLPRMSGINFLTALPATGSDAPVVAVCGNTCIGEAVEAVKLGAVEFLQMPLVPGEVTDALAHALGEVGSHRELVGLAQSEEKDQLGEMLGRAPVMLRLFDTIRRVAPTRATVLVTGETGTGKELVARALHDLSHRARRNFVPVVCSALPDTLLESELFGFVKGSFTGASEGRVGLIEQAAGGTLFLDEVSTLSGAMQVKLLRVIQDRKVQRVGGRSLQQVDFRLVAATNMTLERLVQEGGFRQDLFYRLNVFPVTVPPLRERREDIPLLAHYFLDRFAREQDVPAPDLPDRVLRRMMAYSWPGNVRELEAFMERAVILSVGAGVIRFDLGFSPEAMEDPNGTGALLGKARTDRWPMDRVEREHILSVLEDTGGRKSRAVEILGISRRTLYRKLARYREEGFLDTDVRSGFTL